MKKITLLSCILLLTSVAMAQPGKGKGKEKQVNPKTEAKTTPSGKSVDVPAVAAEEKNAKGMEMKEKNAARRDERKGEKEMDGDKERKKDQDRTKDNREELIKKGNKEKGNANQKVKKEITGPDNK